MGRKRLPAEEVKRRISIRLKKETIDEIKKESSLQEFIEQLVNEKLGQKNDLSKK